MRWRAFFALAFVMLIAGCGGGARRQTTTTGRGGHPSTRTALIVRPGYALNAHLAHRLLRPREACPVTRPDSRSYKPPADLRRTLNGDLRGVYGHGPLAAILPVGRVNVSRDPRHGWYRTKVAWWIAVPGALHIAARRVDRRSTILGHGDLAPPIPTSAHRIEPTNILLPAPGCWQVAGGVGRAVLTWVFRARAQGRAE